MVKCFLSGQVNFQNLLCVVWWLDHLVGNARFLLKFLYMYFLDEINVMNNLLSKRAQYNVHV